MGNMRILVFSYMGGWREEKREKRGFFVGSSWCVSGFCKFFEIKYEKVVFHGVVSLE